MKIKHWLLVSYCLVMLLPILMGAGLYKFITDYHQKLEVEEFIEKQLQLLEIQSVVLDPKLYQIKADRSKIEELTSSSLEINLFSKEGYLIYSSNPLVSTFQLKYDKDELYANLYELMPKFNHYYYKEIVFVDNQTMGFYEVKLARDKWLQGVKDISSVVIVVFTTTLILILLVVMRQVSKKIIHPMNTLITNFNQFPVSKVVIQDYEGKDEMATLYKNVQSMQKEIIFAEEQKRKIAQEKELMIASISHDLKTPLTSIRAYAESINANPSKASEHAPIILDKANYMQKMLADLLMYNLLQSPQYKLRLQKVESSEVFEMLMDGYEELLTSKNQKLVKKIDVSGELEMDVDQWVRLVDNLMSNAVKYTPVTGLIKMIVTEKPIQENLFEFTKEACKKEGIYFIVENEGVGMEASELKKILEPLYQVDAARTKGDSGTGLGLTIAKQIMEKHAGEIQVVSQQSKGTAVICFLPKIKE